MNPEWTINKREKQCRKCTSQFCQGEEYIGTLVREKEFVRSDYCLSCWKDIDENGFFSYWRGRIPEKNDSDEPLSSVEKVEEILRKLIDREDVPSKACYVLAVILERKRIIKQVDVHDDPETGERTIVFAFTKTGESILLEDPHITLEEVPDVQAEIEQIIQQEEN